MSYKFKCAIDPKTLDLPGIQNLDKILDSTNIGIWHYPSKTNSNLDEVYQIMHYPSAWAPIPTTFYGKNIPMSDTDPKNNISIEVKTTGERNSLSHLFLYDAPDLSPQNPKKDMYKSIYNSSIGLCDTAIKSLTASTASFLLLEEINTNEKLKKSVDTILNTLVPDSDEIHANILSSAYFYPMISAEVSKYLRNEKNPEQTVRDAMTFLTSRYESLEWSIHRSYEKEFTCFSSTLCTIYITVTKKYFEEEMEKFLAGDPLVNRESYDRINTAKVDFLRWYLYSHT